MNQRTKRGAVWASAVLISSFLAFGSAASAFAADDDGLGLEVTVTTPTPVASPAPTPTPTSTTKPPTNTPNPSGPPAPGGSNNGGGGNGGGNGGGSGSGGAGSGGSGSGGPAATGDEVSIGGALFLSGLKSTYHPSFNPFDGTLTLEFTVRNVTNETITGSAHFWANGVFGNELADHDALAVADIAPGETRTVQTELPHIGQWIFVNANATFTPPGSVGGVTLEPVTRNAFVPIFPWFLVIIVLIAAAAVVIVRILSPQGAPVPQAAE
ncbi:hypothetical protein [Compostimonas suwonensis]|uniref:DUF916 domain-containing protein n=1 Tax=Compostimonas suwonensis TaxID=1048394 RepID=A0A2M9C357_9MICO|nr:hypothetical protein [Compostimonas suwonensis]PJJ64981.1 hypothetical protein CLV54_0006 [Compostimonas suwonensis]